MAVKDFDAARKGALGEPIEFMLGGERWAVPREIPAWALLEVGAAAAAGEDDKMLGPFVAFFKAVFATPADFERFAAMLNAQRVDLDTITEVVEYVIEESTGRPFEAPSSSPATQSTAGLPSRVVSLSPGSDSRQVG